MTKHEIKNDISLNWGGQEPYPFKAGDVVYYEKATSVLYTDNRSYNTRILPEVLDMIARPYDPKLGRLVIVEGVRNVGKTHMLELLKGTHWGSYKYPFAGYFKANLQKNTFDQDTASSETFHFSTGFDVTLLSMFQQGLVPATAPLVVDRGFLSNIVLGLQQDRVSDEEARRYLGYLSVSGYLKNLTVLYVCAEHKDDDRAKDQWEFLPGQEMHRLYMLYMQLAKKLEPTLRIVRFDNTFDAESEDKFKTLFGVNV